MSWLLMPQNGCAGLCVIAEINWYLGRTQGCMDSSPMRWSTHLRVRVATTIRMHFCIWLLLFLLLFFSALKISDLHLFICSNIPFQCIFLDIYLENFLDSIFDVSYLSRLFLEMVISGGISTTSNIYEYFGRQLKGLQRGLAWVG